MHAICRINFSSTSVHLAKSHFRLWRTLFSRLSIVVENVDQSTHIWFCMFHVCIPLSRSLSFRTCFRVKTNGPFYIINEPCCFSTHAFHHLCGVKTHHRKPNRVHSLYTFNTCIAFSTQSSCERVCMGYWV